MEIKASGGGLGPSLIPRTKGSDDMGEDGNSYKDNKMVASAVCLSFVSCNTHSSCHYYSGVVVKYKWR